MVMLYPSDREVLKQIAFRENGIDGFCWEKKKNIAIRNRLSRQTVHKAYKRLEKADLIVVSWKTKDNKLFVCANTKEPCWFVGNFLLYFGVKGFVKSRSKNGNDKRILKENNISINNGIFKLGKKEFIKLEKNGKD